ncbi:MAG: ABC transporter permease [Deltaproteobacteria bacterium]|nr:ABC transporter permease [Deltaproteobacteria bacterium]
MSFTLEIGFRYLRSKKRATVSVITFIAVTGVALGVGALLPVMSIASGFQKEFRDKVLGVNAHVLVLKYGLDFEEYRDVIAHARKIPSVTGAAPFIINEMMLAKGDRLSGVLIKGIDPELMPSVLDLPNQIVEGSLKGFRKTGAAPALRPEDLDRKIATSEDEDLDAFLAELARSEEPGADSEQKAKQPVKSAAGPEISKQPVDSTGEIDELPKVEVPTPREVEAALEQIELADLPSDQLEEALFTKGENENRSKEEHSRTLPSIVVGKTLAENLGIRIGDRVKIISPLSGLDTSLWRAEQDTPKSRDFRVLAIFEAGFQEYDTRLVYVDLYEAQLFYDQGDTVTGVEISVNDIENASNVAQDLERTLGGGPFHTMDWKELNHNLFTALKIQKLMLSLVITTIIVVAAFNVIATLIIIVLEKRREIAILKAMGARDTAILKIFMVQGTAIGLLGTAIGLVIGSIACAYLSLFEFPLDPKVYLIDHLPINVSVLEFILTVLIAQGICILATLIPSWWAARLIPSAGIRYQ